MNGDVKSEQNGIFVANRLPWPLVDGWTRRTFHVIRQLAGEWPMKLLVLHAGSMDDLALAKAALGSGVTIEAIRPRPYRRARGVVGSLMSGRPFHVVADWDPQLAQLVKKALTNSDVQLIACAGVNMARYLDLAQDRSVVRVVDTHNIDSLVVDRFASFLDDPLRRAYARVAAPALRKWECTVFRRSTLVLVCSKNEVSTVKNMCPDAHVVSIPNGADIDDAGPTAERARGGARRLLFFGRLDYFPNLDAIQYFCDHMLEPLRNVVPNFQLRIVGAGGNASLQALVDRHAELELVGFVADIGAELRAADAVIVPLRSGGGTRLKILEALAAGCAIVSTSAGAEGLEVIDGSHLLLRDDPASFVDAVRDVLASDELARRLGEQGRALAREQYSWNGIGSSLRARVRTLLEAAADNRSLVAHDA